MRHNTLSYVFAAVAVGGVLAVSVAARGPQDHQHPPAGGSGQRPFPTLTHLFSPPRGSELVGTATFNRTSSNGSEGTAAVRVFRTFGLLQQVVGKPDSGGCNTVRLRELCSATPLNMEHADYRRAIGVSPEATIVDSAWGDARKTSRARATSGCLAALVIAPAKENPA